MLDARAYERELRPLLSQAAAYARSLMHDRSDAEDAVQQAALRAWERIHQYDEARPFKGWWFAILRNCCMDAHRNAKRQSAQPIENGDLPDRMAAEVFDRESLEKGLMTLSTDHQEILRLRYFGDLSYDELSEALGIARGTVMSRIHLARKALGAQMRKEEI